MISMSDSDDPTCPRPPPSSARTTSRRRYSDRSSSPFTPKSARGAATSLLIEEASGLGKDFPQQTARSAQLLGLYRRPVTARSGEQAANPALGDKFIQ